MVAYFCNFSHDNKGTKAEQWRTRTGAVLINHANHLMSAGQQDWCAEPCSAKLQLGHCVATKQETVPICLKQAEVHFHCGAGRNVLPTVTHGSLQQNQELPELAVLCLNHKTTLPLWNHRSGLNNHTWQHFTDTDFMKDMSFLLLQTDAGGWAVGRENRNSGFSYWRPSPSGLF